MKDIDFSKKELEAFILLYVANSDLNIDAEEMSFIKSLLEEDKLQKVKRTFDGCNDNKCLEIILSHKDEFFSTPEEKQQLIDEIQQLIQSDDRVSDMEQAAMLGLRRLLR